MDILVLGVTGMLGSTVFKKLSCRPQYQVWGTLRNKSGMRYFPNGQYGNLLTDINVLDQDCVISVLEQVKPDIVINCVGVIKQARDANNPLLALPINAMLPHRLARLCSLINARLIHISTDCVFNGRKGFYTESDTSDAEDLYGKSKYIGELHDLQHAVTLRTSIIGHELNSHVSLVDWFLSQTETVKGYKNAIFSGLPTVELADVIDNYIIPIPELSGLYHVSARPIDKYSLLNLITDVYGKEINIEAEDKVQIDRSLNSTKFQHATSYIASDWPLLIEKMHKGK